MSEIKYTELDFSLIKQNLKNFLKSQDKFKDYNFDGSSLSVLLDVLAYNTGYNAFYLNMLASEMFLDSASLRENVLSRAKHLGYVPRSVRTLTSTINFEVYFESPAFQPPSNLTLLKTQEFFTNVNNTRYTFYPKNTVYFQQIGVRRYLAQNVELVEGKRFTHSWTVDTSLPVKQRFVIPNANVDTTTLLVTVKESSSSSNITIFNPYDDINLVKSTDPVYLLQPYESDKYEIVFGDDIIGKSVTTGNIVTIDYVVSSGNGAFGAKTFRTGSLNGVNVIGTQANTITLILPAAGYSDIESVDSIKILAPRSYESQNRAVTKYDYETILKRDVPIIEHIRVWGGEESDPPEYGKVFCSIKPVTGYTLNDDDKKRIIETYIRPRNLVSLEVVVKEPDYIGMTVDTKVNFQSTKTTSDSDAIKSRVLSAISEYASTTLNGFDSDFRYSKLVRLIDDVDDSIESNITTVNIKYKIIPLLNTFNNFTIKLNNTIDTGDFQNSISSITSSEFFYKTFKVSIADDGKGTLFLYYISGNSKVIVEPNVGTVNYSTGVITITDLIVTSIPNQQNYINIFITPKENDIIALRNQILLLEDSDITIDVVDITRLKLS